MKILILGAGQVGRTVAENLAHENNDVTVVDTNLAVLQEMQNRTDLRAVEGKASYPDVLRDAGAEDADMIIAATDSDCSPVLQSSLSGLVISCSSRSD